MEWWLIALIGVVSLGVGLLLGVFIHNLLKQQAKKREMTLSIEGQETSSQVTTEAAIEEPAVEEPQITEPVLSTPEEQPVAEEPTVEEPQITEPVLGTPEEPVIVEPAKGLLANLLQEIENNISIASEPWAGMLNSFQTTVWETAQDDMDNVPHAIYGELKQTYIDIRLANSIVRLATEFNRRSGSLDDNYRKLCASISEKLGKIKPLLEGQIQ